MTPKSMKGDENEDGGENENGSTKEQAVVDLKPTTAVPASPNVNVAEEMDSKGSATTKSKPTGRLIHPRFKRAVETKSLENPGYEKEEGDGEKPKTNDKRQPRDVKTNSPLSIKPASAPTPQFYIPPLQENVIDAAEAYIQWYKQHPENTLLASNSDSEIRFDAVVQYLSSIRNNPSLISPPSLNSQPSSPNFPSTPPPNPPHSRCHSPPLDHTTKLTDLFTACQKYIASYIVKLSPSHITSALISSLHLSILDLRKQNLISKHGEKYLNALPNSEIGTDISILLERMFKGFSKYHPFLKSYSRGVVKEQVVSSNDVLGVKETVKNRAKKVLRNTHSHNSNWKNKSGKYTKYCLSALLLTATSLIAFLLLEFWTDIAYHAIQGPKDISNTSPGLHIPFLNINIPTPSYLLPAHTKAYNTQLRSFTRNLNITSDYHRTSTIYAHTATADFLNRTETLISDLRQLELNKMNKQWQIFSRTSERKKVEEEVEAILGPRRVVADYFSRTARAVKKLENDRLALRDTVRVMDGQFEALVRAHGEVERREKGGRDVLKSGSNSEHTHAHIHDKDLPLALQKVRKRHQKQSRVAKEHLFVLYDEVLGFMGKVKTELEGGEKKGWWKTISELRKYIGEFKEGIKALQEVASQIYDRVVEEEGG